MIICTADGDILVCTAKGEFVARVPTSPEGMKIECMIAYSHGIICGGLEGFIWPYEVSTNENEFYRL